MNLTRPKHSADHNGQENIWFVGWLTTVRAKPASGESVSLFVFLRDDPQQNGVKLLTPFSNLVFNALSDGTIHFALYGSSLNHNLIG